MLSYATRRLVLSIPTLLFISFVIFMLLQLAPGDPMAQVPLTVPPEVKQKMREALGLGEPPLVQYWKWLVQVFWTEPKVFIDWAFGTNMTEGAQRVISWQTRSPVMDIIIQRIPQTLWVVGTAYVVAILIAIPVGVYSAYKQYSVFDQAGTFVTMIGFSIPPFVAGMVALGMVLAAFSSEVWVGALNSIQKGQREAASALGLSKAQAFRLVVFPQLIRVALPGLGNLAYTSVFARDFPMVQGVLLVVAALVLLINLLVDLSYAVIDPRVRLR